MWLRFTCAKSPILRAMCNYEQKWLVGGAQYVQEPGTMEDYARRTASFFFCYNSFIATLALAHPPF